MWPAAFVVAAVLLLASVVLAVSPVSAHGAPCGPIVATEDTTTLSGCHGAHNDRIAAVIAAAVAGLGVLAVANAAWWGLRDDQSDDRRSIV